MHELGIAEGILSSAVAAAAQAGAPVIHSVDVSIGELTEVMEDALRFAWEAIVPGTLAAGATLNVTMVTPRSECLDCGHPFEHGRFDGARCPACGSYLVTLVCGRELKIDSIDID
jgi:hydrogenase nickel incorporation protein HypA/HybF